MRNCASLAGGALQGSRRAVQHRKRVVLIDEPSRAQLLDYCRIVISQMAAAKQLDQRALPKSC
jgi:hypothetical protein